jgi:hypothetical protein
MNMLYRNGLDLDSLLETVVRLLVFLGETAGKVSRNTTNSLSA